MWRWCRTTLLRCEWDEPSRRLGEGCRGELAALELLVAVGPHPSSPSTPLTPHSVFLPASDIPRFVALGSVSLGITGQDVIAESTHGDAIKELLPLGFGKCKLQVQVPVTGPKQTIEELAGGRIATSFNVLAEELFAKVDSEANAKAASGQGVKTSVEYVGGSVEAACALGMADGIGELCGVGMRWAVLTFTVDLVGE